MRSLGMSRSAIGRSADLGRGSRSTLALVLSDILHCEDVDCRVIALGFNNSAYVIHELFVLGHRRIRRRCMDHDDIEHDLGCYNRHNKTSGFVMTHCEVLIGDGDAAVKVAGGYDFRNTHSASMRACWSRCTCHNNVPICGD